MKASITSGILALLAATLLFQSVPVQAAPAASTVTHSDGVTVKHNADGSIEVYDVPETTTTTTAAPPRRARRVSDSAKANGAAATASSTHVELTPMQPAADEQDAVFAVHPVVSNRKPNKTPQHRTWSHGISAL